MLATFSRYVAALILLVTLWAGGCNQPDHALRGGTQGFVSIRSNTFADLQINVFADDPPSPHRIAFGVSDADGQFSLIDDDGQSAISLPSGKYRITVESVAADPIPIHPRYSAANTTPLITEWSASDTELVIEVN